MRNEINEEARLKAIADFKELEGEINGMPYGLIRIIYKTKITHDNVSMIDHNGSKTRGFDLNYKSIAATIMDCEGFSELQESGVEVYREDGYMLGVMNMSDC